MNIKRVLLTLSISALLISCGSGHFSSETASQSEETSSSTLSSFSSTSEQSDTGSSESKSSESSSESTSSSSESTSSSTSESKSESSSESTSSSSESTSETTSTSSSSSQTTSSSSSGGEEPTFTMQDGTILHAFNWSMNNIKNELSNIKKAGYTSVQLSPMQPQKDYYQGYWRDQWWKLYQPLGFSIAGNNQNVLGNKDDLKNLCKAAEEMDIKIIVDVVTNHLAGGSRTSFNGSVKNFESVIYDNNLCHHDYGEWAKDDNLRSIVQGNIGDYPDLCTEDARVQNRVISMLKEYCDCGVDGFRFDAAKHIETPDDGTYASNYWSNVIGSINNYYVGKGLDKPYIYGEILTTCGTGRSYSSYTNYMSVIDNTQATDLLNAVVNEKPGSIKTTYNTKVNPDHLVLWAESHDTYSNDSHETTNISSDLINKTYMIQASRKDASCLYLVRPGNSQMGQIGTTDYKKASIAGANIFHNLYAHKKENISIDNGLFINIRGDGIDNGAAIINVSNSSSSVKASLGLPNGTYKDLITNNKVTVSSGSATVSFTDGACFLIPENVDPSASTPTVEINADKEVFENNTNVSVSTTNASEAYYQINNGSAVYFTSSTTINVGNNLSNGEITIRVTARNTHGTTVKNIVLLKTSLANKSLIIKNVTDTNNAYLVWCWADGKDGSWYDPTKENNMLGYDLPYTNFIVVKFNKGTTSSSANWDNKLGQTSDMRLTSQIIDFNDLTF